VAFTAAFDKETRMEIREGVPAPDFTLPAHNDQKITLSSFRGRPTVVAFMPFAFTSG
jgi:peroxiredoxin